MDAVHCVAALTSELQNILGCSEERAKAALRVRTR